MFRTNNCSSSGFLYKHLTEFHHASYKQSTRWHDTKDITRSDNDIIQKCASFGLSHVSVSRCTVQRMKTHARTRARTHTHTHTRARARAQSIHLKCRNQNTSSILPCNIFTQKLLNVTNVWRNYQTGFPYRNTRTRAETWDAFNL